MHAVARYGPGLGLLLLLLAPFGTTRAVTAVVGRPAPDLTLPTLQIPADPIRLADYRGSVVYLDFWSSWCAPCRRAMPHLDELRQDFAARGFEVIGVNVDPRAADARRFLDRIPVSYPIAADPAGAVAERFGVGVLPALVVIDRTGVVRGKLVGDAVEAPDALRTTLLSLLEEGEVQ